MFGLGKKIRNPVRGTAQVVGTSGLNPMATHQTCKVTLVVQAEGIPPYSTEHKCTAKAVKWPRPGMTLPVTVDRDDPSRLRIEWDEIPEAGEVHRRQADALAESLRAGGGASVSVQSEAYDPSNPVHAQALQAAEAATGMDLDGDGRVGGAAPATAAGDRVAQLERLAALRDSGALTDAEFEAEKRRLLG
jgi:hypothetical protein